jgi:Magnesium-protoporphyrin IX methyltransferase C-terminus.
MDSLIHYRPEDMAEAVARLADRVSRSLVFTHAPATPLLTLMHLTGKLFPRGDRSPAIVPVASAKIRRLVSIKTAESSKATLDGTRLATERTSSLGRSQRIASGFYISQVQEVVLA